MNSLQRGVANKRKKRELEEEKLKQEPKVDVIAEIVGLVFAVGIVIMIYVSLK